MWALASVTSAINFVGPADSRPFFAAVERRTDVGARQIRSSHSREQLRAASQA